MRMPTNQFPFDLAREKLPTFLCSSLCASIKMATDVNIKPNSTCPGAKATPELQPASITDDTSHFNPSNPTPTAETTTKTETSNIINQCRPKIQNQQQQQPWYNPVRTERTPALQQHNAYCNTTEKTTETIYGIIQFVRKRKPSNNKNNNSINNIFMAIRHKNR